MSLHSRKGGDRPNASDTPRQAGCPGDKGASPVQGAVASRPKELPCVFSIPCGTERPTSTGSRRDGLGEMKAVGPPAAMVVISSCHPCAEMSLHRVGEGGPTGQDEGERVESAIQPRNGKTPQAFAASQLITAGKAISRPCKSFGSVYPGTWVTLGRSGWGHRRRAAGSAHASGTGSVETLRQRPAPRRGEDSKEPAPAATPRVVGGLSPSTPSARGRGQARAG